MATGEDAAQRIRPECARAAAGSKAGRGIAVSRQHLLAPERSRWAGTLQVHARSQIAPVAADPRQPLRLDRRKSSLRRPGADVARTRPLSEGPHARTDRAIR